LGERVSRWFGPIGLATAGVIAALVAGPLGQGGWVFWGGLAVLAVGIVAVTVTRSRRPFPALAVATAFFAIAWLASLPRT
jgi:hypothetical protein